MIIHVGIGAVDGERAYDIITPDKAEALAFQQRYDHEGSSLEVHIDGRELSFEEVEVFFASKTGQL